jgi:hypothetical protein
LKLALPNSIAMFGGTLVAVAETFYIGRLGIEPWPALHPLGRKNALTASFDTGVQSFVLTPLAGANRPTSRAKANRRRREIAQI